MTASERDTTQSAKRAAPVCDDHASGTRAGCLVCALREQDRAFSRIDYLMGEPNEMEVSGYDISYDKQAVVQRVEQLVEDRARLVEALEIIARDEAEPSFRAMGWLRETASEALTDLDAGRSGGSE